MGIKCLSFSLFFDGKSRPTGHLRYQTALSVTSLESCEDFWGLAGNLQN